jgi:hypothetical protein
MQDMKGYVPLSKYGAIIDSVFQSPQTRARVCYAILSTFSNVYDNARVHNNNLSISNILVKLGE